MIIHGAGGGKGGSGGGGISESHDTLSSVAVARFVELVGEGPIVGLVNGEYSIYLDGVPLRDLGGTPNYKPFSYATRPGTQDQDVIPGFGGVQQEVVVGVKVLKSAGPLIRSVPDADADAVRVTVAVGGLTRTTEKGEIQGTLVEYKVMVRVANIGTWVEYPFKIEGKTGSAYQRSHEIPLATLGTGPYQVAVERITDDSTSALLVNALNWDSFAVMNYEQFAYPNSAIIAVQIDARYFNSIPARTYHVKGLLVRVPRNYDPVTGEYAPTGPGTTNGGWDGTFKVAYSNNPAWCYYDLVTHPRYGLGKYVQSLVVSKWQMYEIARYCDEMVPTGNTSNVFDALSQPKVGASGKQLAAVPVMTGQMERRFTLNCVINTLDDAYKVLNNLSSVFRGMTYWRAGSVMVMQDRPGAVRQRFTNANVEGGIFNYEGSSRSQRNTVIQVGWNDPAEDFKQKYEYVEDREGIARYGIRSKDIIAFGCTSRSQARRVGLWTLYTERLETDAITFTTGLDAGLLEIGELITIMDTHRTGVRWGGRLIQATANSVTLDAPLELTVGSYTVMVMNPDGTSSLRPVVIPADAEYTVLDLAASFDTVPVPGAVWVLSSTVVRPVTARVMRIAQKGPANFTITCLQHNSSKYSAIELGVGYEEEQNSFLSYDKVPTVSGLKAVEVSYRPDGSALLTTNVEVSWNSINDPLIRGFQVTMVGTNGQKYAVPETRDFAVTVRDVVPGDYEVVVRAVNAIGKVGLPATVSITVHGVDGAPVPNAGPMSVSITAGGWLVVWPTEADPGVTASELRIGGTDWDSAEPLFKGKTDRCRIPFQLTGNHTLRLRHWAGSRSSPDDSIYTLVILNPGPATLVDTHISLGSVEVEFADATTSQPLAAVEFRRGDGFDSWGTATPAGAAAAGALSHVVVFDQPGTYRVFWRAIDVAGNVGPVVFDDVITTITNVAATLAAITGQIKESMLYKDLGTKINNIEARGYDNAVDILKAALAAHRIEMGMATTFAIAKEELYSFFTEGVEAEAGHRLLLATRVDQNAALITNEQVARTTADNALAQQISTLQAGVGGDVAAIQTEVSAQANTLGHLTTKYTVRTQITANGETVVGGFGLVGTSNADEGPTIDFGVRANKFWIAPPEGTPAGVPGVVPFVVYTTDTVTANGVTIPKGVYMDAAYVVNFEAGIAKLGTAWIQSAMIEELDGGKITADSITTRELVVGAATGLAAKGETTGTINLTSTDSSHIVTPFPVMTFDSTGAPLHFNGKMQFGVHVFNPGVRTILISGFLVISGVSTPGAPMPVPVGPGDSWTVSPTGDASIPFDWMVTVPVDDWQVFAIDIPISAMIPSIVGSHTVTCHATLQVDHRSGAAFTGFGPPPGVTPPAGAPAGARLMILSYVTVVENKV